MLPTSTIKEELSYAFLHAIAARAGFGFSRPPTDYDSVDAVISARGKLHVDSKRHSPSIEIQLKASSTIIPSEDIVKFPLPVKNYNELRADTALPRILILLSLPSDESDWLSVTADYLITKRCAYWHSLAGADAPGTETTKTVSISTANYLTVAVLSDIMVRASKLERI